jgi:fimbrial chaperone protein
MPSWFASRSAFCLAALAVLGTASAVQAQSLAVQPVVVQLAPGQMAETLTILNQSSDPSAFQVRAFTWETENGADKLTPTDKVAISPPLGTIAPNQRQLIRVVLRQPAQAREETYRIWIDQIPAASEPGSIRIALRLSIPIFSAPATRVAPDLQWRLTRAPGGLLLTATNTGTRHQAVRNIGLATPDGRALKPGGNTSPYVLAGGMRQWTFAAPEGAPASLRLTATTQDGPLDRSLVPGSPP